MAATFHRPTGLKYTDMCIYIDNHINEIVETGKNPEVESKIFEYLYHILYALSYKAMFFKKFEDYDSFATMAAAQLFISMKNKAINAGKIIRGKEVKPIKSCLNFIKSILFPLKINYQRDNFSTILNPEINQDTSLLTNRLKESVRVIYRDSLQNTYRDVLKKLPDFIDQVLWQTPYRNDKLMIKRLKLSCILTLVNDFTLPTKLKNKLKARIKDDNNTLFDVAYRNNVSNSVLLWHLDEKYTNYVLLLVRKIKSKFSHTIENDFHEFDLSENLVDSILESAYSNSEESETGEE